MRKIFSFLTAILFAGSMMAADLVTVKSTFTKATVPANDAVTDLEGVVTWSIATEVGAGTPSYTTGKNNQIECLKFGAKAAEYFSKVTLSTDYYEDYNVKSVTLYVLNNGKKTGTLTVKQGETTIGTASEEFGTAWTALTATGVTGNGGTLEVSYEVAQASYWSYIEVQYETSQGGEGGETISTVKTVYCKVAQDWWKTDGAAVGVYAYADGGVQNAAWPGVRMTAVEGETDLWKADIDTAVYTAVIFTRVNASGDIADWGAKTADLTIPADKNLYTITSTAAVWGDPGVTGEWSVYTAQGGDDPTPAEKDSIYFVNVAGWAAPRVHLWGGTAAGTEWPGVEMTKLEDQINNYDVYKYVADKGAYVKCIFSDNGENQTADLDWTSGKYFYNDAWYALNEIPVPLPDAVPLEGNIWKVTAETPLVAGSHYINEALLKMDGVYATSLKTNTRTIAGEEFTHAIQVRTDGYPTADNKVGKEKSGSTSLIITAKEDADVTFYYNRQVVGEGGTDNDNKDLIVFDQADITTKVAGVFTIDQILEGNNYLNATKKVALKKDHIYTVTASGTTLQLHGIKLEAHTPVIQIAGAWNVQDEAWLLNDMSLAEDKLTATYEVELAKGDYEFKMIKDGAWLTKANEGQPYGLHREWPGVAGVIDDASENLKVTADVAGNYTFTWTFANDSIGIAFPDAPIEPTPKYYIIGAGEAFGEWSFVPVMQDTFKLSNLAAGDYMFRVALENGNWENTKGYSDLTEKTEGLSANNDNNILFTLAEAGDVAVVYNDSVFRVIGNFYVDPTPVVPTAAVTGDMTEWGEPIPFELSEDKTFATLYNDNIKKGTYAFKMIINGDWRSNGYEFHRGFPGCAGITGNTVADMTVVIDVEGAYTFKWYFANDSLAIIFPEKPEPVLADGFYLVGKFSGVDAWSVEDLSAEKLFAANPDTEGEYQLSIDLAVDDEIKVVYVAEDVITTWYPKEGNYIVDDHHNGPTTMYFRPEYNSDWSAFGGYFYLVPTSTVGFENSAVDAKAVKSLKNGILVIEKNNKTYNVMGQMVK